jgi:hypothetical protein
VLIWIAFGGTVKISWARPKHAAFTSSDHGRLRGDLKATAAGEHGATIEMSNVIFVDRKVVATEKLISGKPERTS